MKRLRFNREARKSLAETLKILSYLGPGAAQLMLGSLVHAPELQGLLFVFYCVVFVILQAVAIALVAYEDDDEEQG